MSLIAVAVVTESTNFKKQGRGSGPGEVSVASQPGLP